jgi:hypothetical protein
MLQSQLAMIVLFLTLSLSAQVALSQGVIRGKVIDENGVPLVGAQVHAELHGVPMGKAIRYVQSNGDGSFVIDRLDFGTFDVNGGKEQDGYPQSDWSLYADKALATVTISLERPTADVVLRLGPKAATLVGAVRDQVTGKPMNSAFLIRRSENRWVSTSAPPDFHFLIPSDTPIDVEVSAPGYKTWRYADEFGGGSPLQLQSATEKRLEVELTPATDGSKRASKFLVPEGYVGWLLLEFNVKNAPVVPVESDMDVYTFPGFGRLKTSSSGPVDGAPHGYFYYSQDGSVSAVPLDYRKGRGMVWGEYSGSAKGEMCMFGFFVGNHEEYEKRRDDSQKGVDRPCQ